VLVAVRIAEQSLKALRNSIAEETLQEARLTLARTRVALVPQQIGLSHLTGALVPGA
jgi:hypothetical protein